MTNTMEFTYIRFEPKNWEEFVRDYNGCIRTSFKDQGLSKDDLETGLTVVSGQSDVRFYLPAYSDPGDWRDGIPYYLDHKLGHFYEPLLVRIPAIRLSGASYFVLDGVHRLTELRPQCVVVDWIRLTNPNKRGYIVDLIVDLYNPYLWAVYQGDSTVGKPWESREQEEKEA